MSATHPTDHNLRLADVSDAGVLATLMERTFRDTFGAFNTEEQMADHCQGAYAEPIQRAEIRDPDIATFVYTIGGTMVGFAQVRPGKRPDGVVGSTTVEIHRIYVDTSAHGNGVAQSLMDTALSDAAQRGADTVWLGVWERNPRALRFYAKFGFEVVGEHVFHVGSDAQRDLIMSRSLRS